MLFHASAGRVLRSRRRKSLATRLIPGARKRAITMLASLAAAPALATTYYVSPTGSDVNSGTNPNVPWGSVAKVDATTFQPGDQILFQYGSTLGREPGCHFQRHHFRSNRLRFVRKPHAGESHIHGKRSDQFVGIHAAHRNDLPNNLRDPGELGL